MSYAYPPPPPEKKSRGCFFWGCITVIILFVVGLLIVGGSMYALYRYVINTAKEYSETAPMPLPPLSLPEAERKELDARIKAFGDAAKAGTATEPLVLSADDVNALIDDTPRFKGKARVAIEGDKIKAKFSIPLDDLIKHAELKARYLNATATLLVSFKNGILDVHATDVLVKDKPLPDAVAQAMRDENMAKDAMEDSKVREVADKIESLEVKGGKIYITPRSASKTPDSPPAEAKPAPNDGDAKGAEPKETPKDDAKDASDAPKEPKTS